MKKVLKAVIKGKLVDISEISVPILTRGERRGEERVFFDVLFALQKYKKKTNVMYVTNLSHTKLTEIIEKLQTNGLVVKRKGMGKRYIYTLTQEGKEVLTSGAKFLIMVGLLDVK